MEKIFKNKNNNVESFEVLNKVSKQVAEMGVL
jgi:hypothetical protein